MEPIRILLVDDQRSVRRGLSMRFALEPDIEIVGEAADGAEAIKIASILKPDIMIMDYEMPNMDGVEPTVRRPRPRACNSKRCASRRCAN
jgi:YesN/AraC family two-component response regulator